ncbi:hypothetical protein BJ138DRAFT_1019060 [Hygrophoropsis aurantiaca]|uniref:Uncharacterized protein n=1 Tax=Hygrophoropsis aurantiaca TaxID=72124 RepID=A0ACB7ZTI1_9AGAM|nr:hypothetical protein BJ138DRAFT_1019060 [Hygrophoropsis aurantiaca]
MAPQSDFAAEFTMPDATKPRTCDRCNLLFPPKTEPFYMQDVDPNKQGRWLCLPCHDYYLTKATTKRRVQPGVSDNLTSLIYQAMAPPVFIPAHRPNVLAQANMFQPAPDWPGRSAHSRNSIQSRRSSVLGPNIEIYGRPSMTISSSVLPDSLISNLPASPGYGEAHALYHQMRTHLARRAYASSGVESVTINAYLMARAGGKKQATMVGDITESIGNIPVHIGARDLKTIVYVTLHPMFVKWSLGLTFTLDHEDVHLRLGKSWLEIHPRVVGDDIDAIATHFISQTAKGGTKFKPGKLELHLEISKELYNEAQTRIDHASEGLPLDSPSRNPAHSLRTNLNEPDEPSTPPQKARTLEPVVSPEVDIIRAALQAQYTPIYRSSSANFSLRSIPCLFYVVPLVTLAELLSSPVASVISDDTKPLSINLIFDPKDKGKSGGFKKAIVGHTSKPVLGPAGYTDIVLKQFFYHGKTTQHIYDNRRQIRELEGEVKCLKWANALMNLVYDFIKAESKLRGDAPFSVPQVRYVAAALATTVDEKGSHTYLVEELINEKTEGKFIKYISNDKASPLPLGDPELYHIAEFLSFAQHVQYIKSKKTLLTDPQIITAP